MAKLKPLAEEWEDKTGHTLNCPCKTCTSGGFEVIEVPKAQQELSSIKKRRLGIPPHCDSVDGMNLNLFCTAKSMYITWLPYACQLYTDIKAETELDGDFLNK